MKNTMQRYCFLGKLQEEDTEKRVFDRIDWAYSMLHNFFKLPPLGKSAFGFLQKQACFIEEMKNVMDWYRHMEELIKEKGLSRKTSNECKRYIHATFMQQNKRLRNLG